MNTIVMAVGGYPSSMRFSLHAKGDSLWRFHSIPVVPQFGGSSVRGAGGGSSKSQTELRKEVKGDGLAFLGETMR